MLIVLCRSSLGRNGRKRDKNQANWMRIEEVVQIIVIVTTMAFIVVTMTQDSWKTGSQDSAYSGL